MPAKPDDLITQIIANHQFDSAVICLSEGMDARILQGAIAASTKFNIQIMLVGDDQKIYEAAKAHNLNIGDRFTLLNPSDKQIQTDLAACYYALRKHKNITPAAAENAVQDPLVAANLLVKMGKADGTVNGAVYTTADVVRNALQIIGKAPTSEVVSSFFLLAFNHAGEDKLVAFADCGLIIEPSVQELKAIALSTADSYMKIAGETPHIAMLSFSTKGSARHRSIDKTRDATLLIKAEYPDLHIDGELQFDAAFDPKVAAMKAPDSPVAGKANIFVFPNLAAGNIGYKIAQQIGGAVAIGPILQGLAKPANDLSRGCSASDVTTMIALSALFNNQS